MKRLTLGGPAINIRTNVRTSNHGETDHHVRSNTWRGTPRRHCDVARQDGGCGSSAQLTRAAAFNSVPYREEKRNAMDSMTLPQTHNYTGLRESSYHKQASTSAVATRMLDNLMRIMTSQGHHEIWEVTCPSDSDSCPQVLAEVPSARGGLTDQSVCHIVERHWGAAVQLSIGSTDRGKERGRS